MSTTLHDCNEDSRTSHASSQLPFHYSTPNGSNGCIGYCLCLHHHTVPTLQTPVSKSCVPASTSCIHSIGHLRPFQFLNRNYWSLALDERVLVVVLLYIYFFSGLFFALMIALIPWVVLVLTFLSGFMCFHFVHYCFIG